MILLAILAGVLLILVWMPLWAVRGVSKAFPGTIWMVQTREPVVALTFDDGPHPVHTPQVLDILKRHNAHATFFLIGERARQHPELIARIRAEGHEIGNHTDSMKTTLYMSAERFEQSLQHAEQTLELDEGRKLMRPAGGLIRPSQVAAAKKHGYTVVVGSSYAWDPERPPTAYIRWAIAKNLRPGAIAVLHDAGGDRSRSVAALEGILADAEQKRLRCVTLSELLARAKR
jgi:peptidoglycan/xylan/chitin deacetylase (PgdA/CDA1 family)